MCIYFKPEQRVGPKNGASNQSVGQSYCQILLILAIPDIFESVSQDFQLSDTSVHGDTSNA